MIRTKLKLSHVTAALVAVLVGYTSSVAIILQAIEALGATTLQATSWLIALGIGMGISSLALSLWYRMPILTAWSTPGAALIATSAEIVTLPQAIGAFLFCAALLTLTGLSGWFERLSAFIPNTIANALLAGILFQFGLATFTALGQDTALVTIMALTYLAGRLWFVRYTVPATLVVGIIWTGFTGTFSGLPMPSFSVPSLVIITPEYSLSALIGLGLPLYIVTMCSQNVPGVLTLRAAGYAPPVSAGITVTGLTGLILAPFGGYAFNFAAITAAICANPDADHDPNTRYIASALAGGIYCLVGLAGAALLGFLALAPPALIATIAGLALLPTIGNSLSQALSEPQARDPALITFLTTVSGLSFFGIGAAFWGLILGVIAHLALIKRC